MSWTRWSRPSTCGRRILVDGLRKIKGITCPEPLGAFYAFPERHRDREVQRRASRGAARRSRRWPVVPVTCLATPWLGQHLRFSYAASDDDLREGIARMSEVLGTV